MSKSKASKIGNNNFPSWMDVKNISNIQIVSYRFARRRKKKEEKTDTKLQGAWIKKKELKKSHEHSNSHPLTDVCCCFKLNRFPRFHLRNWWSTEKRIYSNCQYILCLMCKIPNRDIETNACIHVKAKVWS